MLAEDFHRSAEAFMENRVEKSWQQADETFSHSSSRPGIVRSRKIFIKVRKVVWKRMRQKVEISELGVEGCGFINRMQIYPKMGNCYNTFECIHSC